jgi:crotonobetainyl-CoA:carnitine CoA-transferase CaiB-like acyl-CoA transferase
MTACHAVLGALLHRATSGEGQVVSTSLLEAATAFVGESAARHLNLAPGEEAGGERRDRRQALAQVYLLTSGDGLPLVIHLSSPTKFWRAMCEALGIDDLAADEALDRRSERTRNFRRIRDRVQQRVNELTRAECLELLIEAGVPAAPVNRVDDVVVDPQVAHLDMVWTLDVDDERGTTRTIRPGFSMSAGGPELRLPPPLLGEHDSALLGE